MTNPDNLCVDKDGNAVLLVKLWKKRIDHLYLSVYGYTGWHSKRSHLLHRERVEPDAFDIQVAKTHAHLWALRNGVSDYVVMTRADEPLTLFHPRKENLNELR